MTVRHLTTEEEFTSFIADETLTAVHFYASWAPQCDQLNIVLGDLQSELPAAFNSSYIDAEGVPSVSLKMRITAAPTVVFFRKSVEVGRVNGYQPGDLKTQILRLSAGLPTPAEQHVAPPKEDLNSRLKRLVTQKKMMVFMKGNPAAPQCGFSRQVVELLKGINADYGSFDILQDEEVRQGLKEYSNWPTYPQLYLNGELIGGLDVIREELQDPAFVESIPKKETLNDRLKRLVNASRLMLFMKGNADAPKCGFSRQTVDLLNGISADFKTFDILSDETVRQGLKEYSNWPTYPQLYLDGELVGGLDVIREELQDAEFLGKIPKKG